MGHTGPVIILCLCLDHGLQKLLDVKMEFERSAEVVMLDIFRACIETGILPTVDSPCHAKVIELIAAGSKPPENEPVFKPGCV